MSAGRAEARREHLESAVGAPGPAHHRRRLAVVGASVGVAVLVAAGSAAAYVSRAPATDPTYARCYLSASLAKDAVGTDVSMAFAPGEPEIPNAPAHALEMCATWWNLQLTGVAHYDGATDGNNTPPVPDLVACVLKNGAVGVFPGDDQTCFELGLPALATG